MSLIYGCNFDATVSVHELLYISVICFGIALFSSYLKSFICPQNNQALNFFLATSFVVPKIFFFCNGIYTYFIIVLKCLLTIHGILNGRKNILGLNIFGGSLSSEPFSVNLVLTAKENMVQSWYFHGNCIF